MLALELALMLASLLALMLAYSANVLFRVSANVSFRVSAKLAHRLALMLACLRIACLQRSSTIDQSEEVSLPSSPTATGADSL